MAKCKKCRQVEPRLKKNNGFCANCVPQEQGAGGAGGLASLPTPVYSGAEVKKVPSGMVAALQRMTENMGNGNLTAEELPEGVDYEVERDNQTFTNAEGLFTVVLRHYDADTRKGTFVSEHVWFDSVETAHEFVSDAAEGLEPADYGFGDNAGVLQSEAEMSFIVREMRHNGFASFGLNEKFYDEPEVELKWANHSAGKYAENITPEGTERAREAAETAAAVAAEEAEQKRLDAIPKALDDERKLFLKEFAWRNAIDAQFDREDETRIHEFIMNNILEQHPEAEGMRPELEEIVSDIVAQRWEDEHGW